MYSHFRNESTWSGGQSSAELDHARSQSTRQSQPAPLGPRCQPTSLTELKAMPFWQTFYDRLGVVVFGHPVPSFMFDFVGFSVETAFDVYFQFSDMWLTRVQERAGEPLCYVTTTYSKEAAIPASGPLTIDYPTGSSTVDVGPVVDLTPGPRRQYVVEGLYSDALGNSFGVDVNREHGTNASIWGAPGTICSHYYLNTTCIQDATGQTVFRLEGGVRVGYNSRVNGHYYWHLWFDDWIPGDQAWSYSQFKATITTSGSNSSTSGFTCK
ncbi:hypothetical protein B0H16DRAFT_1465030 [Mycena metata]|uniref:Uncharacterized protein n=1 Tax=Mycena metata TaxID=1033252 RepID=A0AAD7ID85_9AGAR|nr:hypothetical protein B0H16DRAFT_1465030 [Mycena metata]